MKTVFRFKKKKNLPSLTAVTADSALLMDLNHTKEQIDTLLIHLGYQTDPDMIDSYTYQLKGAYMQYKFLLRQIEQERSCP